MESGDYDDAVSRAYYSAFHAASALIAMNNPEYRRRVSSGIRH
jgi:uncharacterized protein (UPF0332 family)